MEKARLPQATSAGSPSPRAGCEPAPGRVQSTLRQRRSSWSQSACFSQPPLQQPASAIPEFCPPPSSKLFPISCLTPGSGYSLTFALRWMFILPPLLSWPDSEKASVLSAQCL